MEDERAPALVFCGPTLTPGFLEVAVAHQLQSRAFHAPDPAECPVPLKVRSGSQLVVYSPASQQWSTTPNGAKAAVAVAGSQIVASDASLVAWAACHRYPGITSLGYKNFQDWLRTNRSSLLVAVNVHSSNKDVERRLKETGNPRGIGAMEEYTYKPSDHDLGVADGKLEGLSYFGVNYRDLPRVVVFEDANTWVEDITELTLDRLNLDLMKVPSLWRMSGSFKGHVLWALKELRWNYRLTGC
ncbi:unnamed protein product [Polarella glacialis]|uniref:Uncharacterized protein n=1 Tax=Polarella glacialis TaxID=89957 RepID=A0A813ILD4_POLGL|nr:unnamed protein product [Polarella glacialis]CAE8652693.1 unnamed protein product [Polarella glacialis]